VTVFFKQIIDFFHLMKAATAGGFGGFLEIGFKRFVQGLIYSYLRRPLKEKAEKVL
jgi:hypothetical protein